MSKVISLDSIRISIETTCVANPESSLVIFCKDKDLWNNILYMMWNRLGSCNKVNFIQIEKGKYVDHL
jgi:hypothetical protein